MSLDPHSARTVADLGGAQLAASHEIRVAIERRLSAAERELGLALASRERWMFGAIALGGANLALLVVLFFELWR